MNLNILRKGTWLVCEVCGDSGESPLLCWFNKLNANYAGSARRLLSIIKTITETPQGPRLLPHGICHEVDKKNCIYEFIAGDLRLLWFYSRHQKKVVLCGGPHLKKGRKVNKNEIKHIIKLKKEYSEAHSEGNINFFNDGEKV